MTKRRTREHIIADLSVNYVERFLLVGGHVPHRVLSDYGYDLFVQTFDEQGAPEPGFFPIQLKATDAPGPVAGGREFALVVEMRDLNLWSAEVMPVILVLFDAVNDTAYWLHVQEEIGNRLPDTSGRQTATVRFKREQEVTREAVEVWQGLKADAIRRVTAS